MATNRRGRRIHTIIIMGRGCHTSRSPNTGRGSVVRRGATAIHGIEAAKAWDRETGLRQTPCTNDPGNIREWAGVPTHWSAASYTPQIRPPNRHQVAVDLRFLRSEEARDYAPADSLNIILKPDQNQVKAAAGRGRGTKPAREARGGRPAAAPRKRRNPRSGRTEYAPGVPNNELYNETHRAYLYGEACDTEKNAREDRLILNVEEVTCK